MRHRTPRAPQTTALRPAALAAGLLILGAAAPAAAACVDEAACAVKKPLLLFVLDYSTSMNSPFSGNQTRWEAAVDALVDTLAVDEGLLADQLQIGVLRFGHDPDPGAPGTTIAGDASGLVDGQHLDLGFYDPLAPDKAYLQCNGDAVKDALLAVQSPLGGQQDGIESWTGGASGASPGLPAADRRRPPARPRHPRRGDRARHRRPLDRSVRHHAAGPRDRRPRPRRRRPLQ
ncbi:vWA domain-containing protein [Nannocystis pusilla]|uniref:vWA domain-containing protein n=1 Tax=Nannocystis pusilla TaxID=889268 RepID=UPI003DA3E7E0